MCRVSVKWKKKLWSILEKWLNKWRMFLKIEHMNYTPKVNYSFFHTQEKMFFNNKTPSCCNYIVVNLCRWYQMKVFLHEYYGTWECSYSDYWNGYVFCIFKDLYQRYNHLLLKVHRSCLTSLIKQFSEKFVNLFFHLCIYL